MLHDHDATLLDAGRRRRRPAPALRRAVRERDQGRCRFPGCRSRRTDIHHIILWAPGGTTRLRNLILLCQAHHLIVHAHGYQIRRLIAAGCLPRRCAAPRTGHHSKPARAGPPGRSSSRPPRT